MVVVSKFLRFFSNSELKTKTKKKSSSQNLNEIRCKFTKIPKKQFLLTNSRAVNIYLGVLGLELHSSSTESVNFFGAQFSLGGAQFSFGGHKQSFGGARPGMPPRGAGPDSVSLFPGSQLERTDSGFPKTF